MSVCTTIQISARCPNTLVIITAIMVVVMHIARALRFALLVPLSFKSAAAQEISFSAHVVLEMSVLLMVNVARAPGSAQLDQLTRCSSTLHQSADIQTAYIQMVQNLMECSANATNT